MNRRLWVAWVLLIFLATSFVLSGSRDGPPVAEPAGSSNRAAGVPPLLFVSAHNLDPIVYLDGTVPSGLGVDLLRALAKHLPRPVDIRLMDWAEAQKLVLEGKADALMPMNRTEERERLYDFSDPFLESYFSIYARSDVTGITSISSLRGLRVGVVPGGLPRVLLGRDPEVRVVTVRDFSDGFDRLSQGTIDAVVADARVGPYILARDGIRNIKTTGDPIQWTNSTIAVKKGNTELIDEINNALRIIKNDGTYQRTLDEWAPTEAIYETRAQINARIYRTVTLALFALLLIAAAWILTIRRQLNRRRAAEQHARRQYSTLRSIIDSVDASIFSLDTHYCYTSYNQRHSSTMKALHNADIEPGHSIVEYFTDPGVRETVDRILERALTGERFIEETYSGEPPTRRYFETSHSPIEAETGEVIGVTVLSQEITERKRVDDEIRRLNRELEQRVRDRTAQLQATNRDLEAFAYSVSHDLRAPLRHIRGLTEILLADYGTQLEADAHRMVTAVHARSQRMGELIEDLLCFSRNRHQEPSRQQVDLNALVKEVIRDADPETCQRHIRWQIASLPVVTGDRAMLQAALTNLVSNALKFTRHRAVGEIEIGVTEQTGAWAFFVRDNGVGFDQKHADKLFGVFQRLHREAEFEGTGIGLAHVRQIIERHGGQTWAEGEVDHGATVHFSLPRDVVQPAT